MAPLAQGLLVKPRLQPLLPCHSMARYSRILYISNRVSNVLHLCLPGKFLLTPDSDQTAPLL